MKKRKIISRIGENYPLPARKINKVLLITILGVLSIFSSNAQTAFTPGNLVVVRIGNGSAALGTGATQVAVAEYSTAGTSAQTITFQSSTTIPAAGVAPFLNVSGSTANEGFGSTAIDGSFFTLLGYNVTNGTASVNGAASTNLRAIGRAAANGALSIPISTSAYGGTATIRSVASDGSGYWATTSATTAGNGLAYITSSGTVTTVNGLNGRCVGIFNGQLFASSASTVQAFGTGLPTSSAAGTTIATVTSANAFSFSPNHDVLYVADESGFNATATSCGGIRKFTRAAGSSTWIFQYTLNSNGTSTTIAARGLVVDWSGASPVIYFTEGTASANRIMKVTDNGSALSSSNTAGNVPTQVLAGSTNIRLAGISFAPKTPSIILSGTSSVAPHSRAADSYTEGFGPITTATTSFVVNGYNLGGNITVTAPSNFQVSTNPSSGFASSITLSPTSGSVTNQTVYVRMSSGLLTGAYSGYVSVTASGCMQPGGVYVTGNVNSPTPSITTPASLPVSISGFVTTAGTVSSNQTITLTAANLTSALTLNASSGFEISTSAGSGFSSSLNLGTSISGLIIYIRLASTATSSTTSGTLTTSSSDAPVNNLTIANLSSTVYSGQFTSGNIAVQVLGDGTTSLTSAAARVNVWELNSSTGAIANQFILPNAATLPSSAPFNVTESGSATSGGQMVRSSNGAFLSVSGYNATVGSAGVVGTTTPTNKRVLAQLGQNGSINTSAYDFFSGNNFRSTASNGYSFWSAGTVNSGVGLYYLQNASSTPVSLGSINTRVVQVYNNNLYFSTASGGAGIYQVGSNGIPVKAADAVVTRLTDATYLGQAGASPYSFSINPAGNILYIADDANFSSTSTQVGGIIKYTKTGSTWSYQYTLRVNSSITNGARGLDVDWSGANPILYITSANGTQIYKLTDTGIGASGSGVQLGTNAPSNYIFRGLQLAPVSQPTELTCTANSLDFGGQPPAGVTPEKVFNVAGSGFIGNITVSVPSTVPSGQYGISFTSGGPYSSSLTITGSGTPNSGNATIYMVFQPSTVGSYNGNLTISATGVTSLNVPVTGACILPINYYNVSGADVTNPNNWGTNTDGSGTKPVNFTDNGQYFNLVNNPGALSAMQTIATLSPAASTLSGTNILTFSNPPSCPNSPVSLFVGATITGTNIPAGTTIIDITGNVITLSQNATATGATSPSVPVTAGWSISGVISKLIIGNGVVARTFTIPSTHAYSGTVDVKNLGNLILQNTSIPTLGVLELNSTVTYNQTGTSTVVIPSNNGPYGNLTLLGGTPATDIRNLPASNNLSIPFQVLGNFTVDGATVLGATAAPFTYMGLQGNLTGANGAIFGGNPPTATNPIPSIITIGDNNQTISYPSGTVRLYTFTSSKTSGTLTLGSNTTLLTYGQTGGLLGTTLNYSGTASFVSNTGSILATTGTANVDVTFTGSGSFTLGGNINANNTSSSSLLPPIPVNSSVYLNFAAGTTFNDGGNTLNISNNFGTKGAKAAYNFTGSVTMSASSGTTRLQNDNTLQGLFVADLNNLSFNPTGTAANLIVQPLTGNNTLTIKGNFNIGGTATGSKFQPNSNTIQIGGNFNDTRTIDMIAAGTSTFEFNGTVAQTFSTAFTGGESMFNVKLDNAAGLTLTSGDIKISSTGNLNCNAGILNTGINKVLLNNTATITESTSSYVLGFVNSTRTLTNTQEAFGGMGLKITALGTQPGSTLLVRETGSNTAVGCSNTSIKRKYTLTPTNNTSLNATVVFGYLESVAELNGLTESSLGLYSGGGPWNLISTLSQLNTTNNEITVTGINTLSSFTAASGSPNASAGGSSSLCGSGTATVSGASSTFGTLLWTHNGSGSISNATTLTPSYTAGAGDVGNTVTLTLTSSNSGCTDATATYSVIVNAIPVATAGGSAVSCENGSVTVSGATAANGTINWTHNGTGSISNANTITPTYTCAAGDAGNTVTLTLSVTGVSPCVTVTATYTINVRPRPTVTPSPVNICTGTPVGTINIVSPEANTDYKWSPATDLYTDAGLTSPYVLGTAASTVYTAPFSNTSYNVTATNTTNSCTTGATAVSVVVCPAANNDICQADAITAIPVTTTGAYTQYSLTGATPSIFASCSPISRDIWYRAIVPANGEINVITAPGTNANSNLNIVSSVVSIFTASSCSTSVTLAGANACNSNGAAGNMSYARANGLTPGSTVYIRVASSSTGNPPAAQFIRMAVSNGLVWTAAVDDDFNNAANWVGGDATALTKPDAGISANIPHTVTKPKLNANSNVNGINFTSGPPYFGSPGINLNGFTLNVKGSWNVGPSLSSNLSLDCNGIVEFNGTGALAQTISGKNNFGNLTINNTAGGVTLSGSTSVSCILKTTAGTLNSAGLLTLRSSSTATALVDPAAGTISGDVNVERKIGPVGGYHYLSSPVQNAFVNNTVSGWRDDFTIIASLDNLQFVPGNVYTALPTVFEYDETNSNPNPSYGWVGATGTTDAITPLKGFACIVNSNVIVDVFGPLNNGPINYNVTKATDGINVIGNPYPSPISWTAFRSHNTNLETTYKAFVSSGGYNGTYGDYNIATGLGTNGVGNLIASSQAFVVTANTAGAIQAVNADRTTDLNPTFFAEPVVTNDILRLELVKDNSKDEIVIFFAPGLSTDNFESLADAKKVLPVSNNRSFLYSILANTQLSMNGLGDFNVDKVVPLGLKVAVAGSHDIVATDLSSFAPSAMIYLYDAETGAIQNLRTNPSYSAYLSAGTNEGRFFIQFTPAVQLFSENATCNGNDGQIKLVYSSAASVNVSIKNEAGIIVAQINNFNGQQSISNLAAGNYEVSYTHSNGFVSIDYITIAGAIPVNIQANASVSQAATGQSILFTSANPWGTTHWNFGDGTSAIGNSIAHSFNNEGIYTVTATASNGECTQAVDLNVEITSATGIENLSSQGMQWLISNNQVTVKFVNSLLQNSSIEMIDLSGKLVYSNTISKGQLQHTIATAKFAEGIYLVKITCGNQIQTKKLVVSK